MLRKGSTPLDVALADLARRQWGVVSLAQLRALGLGSRAVQLRAETGRLRRVHRGVYAVGGAVLPREGRWLAAVMACGPGAVLSHLSAAVHWNLLQYDAPQPHVSAPASREGAPGIRLHRTRSLDAQDTTRHQGIPTTTVHRTLLDLAATVRSDHLERALAQAERLQLYDHRAVESVLARSSGHRGRAILERAVASDPQFTRSELEARMRRLAREHGLPRPVFNISLAAHDHQLYEVDCYFPTHRLVVETDGWDTHRTRQGFEADRAKDAALTAAGYVVLRFTWRQLRYDPDTVAERIEAIVAYRSASASRNASSSGSSIE
jgi:very-short-patch-repair endonuclease/predicted transcriptional regulator of viral defense system